MKNTDDKTYDARLVMTQMIRPKIDIQARKLYLEFALMNLDSDETHLRTFTPGFWTEFRYLLCGQSGLAWRAILRKMLGLSLLPRYPCSFFWEQGPKMVSAPNVPTTKEHVNTNMYICIEP